MNQETDKLDMSGTTLEPISNDHPKIEEVIEEETVQLNHHHYLNNLGPKMSSLKYQTNRRLLRVFLIWNLIHS